MEGIDGSGKSTQAGILIEKLRRRDFDTVYFREPSDSRWGREIRDKAVVPDSLTPEEEIDLFQKDRKENVRKNLRPALKKKKVIVLDRYYFSTIAYQGAKGIDPRKIRLMNEAFAVPPDILIVLDIDPKKGLKRIGKRKKKDVLFEREDYLVEVRKIFNGINGENVYHIDASASADKVSLEVEDIVFSYIEKYALS